MNTYNPQNTWKLKIHYIQWLALAIAYNKSLDKKLKDCSVMQVKKWELMREQKDNENLYKALEECELFLYNTQWTNI